MTQLRLGFTLLVCLFLHATAWAEGKILLGQSVELSGQATGKENREGALLYFDWLNKQGGVNGKSIELISYDDQRDPAKTKENTLKLINDDHVIALFGYRSTPTIEAVLPLLEKYRIPLIAPFSGALSLHQPLQPYVFNLRASYRDEAAKMVDSLADLQIRQIAILHQDDSFGKDGLNGFVNKLGERKLQAAVIAKYDRKDMKLDAAVAQIAATTPQAVLMACTPSACADFIRQMQKTGQKPRFLMLSNVNSDEFFKSLGDNGRGIGVMQVMPYPRDFGIPVVRELQKVLKSIKNPPPLSYAVLEGFVAAKLMAEALRRAGNRPDTQKLSQALENMRQVDLGGVQVSYSAKDHDGSHFVELTIVGKNGAILR
ncbi:ABC transporter substrate-binding protein [Undibacterium sp. Di26W]|uniref:ABC transporter substrate-binding protein n=1 Tax=Undibacterium sp. Di26W TaxID=3413035 RepID=UPI003BF1A3C8